MAKFEVKYYRTVTERKTAKEPYGTFYPVVEIAEIPEVSENLKGLADANGEDLYEAEVRRREKKIEKALVDAKFAACDEVRAIVGESGVLVANIVDEEV